MILLLGMSTYIEALFLAGHFTFTMFPALLEIAFVGFAIIGFQSSMPMRQIFLPIPIIIAAIIILQLPMTTAIIVLELTLVNITISIIKTSFAMLVVILPTAFIAFGCTKVRVSSIAIPIQIYKMKE
jgi:hypothetical protein